jgi:hypothetical protein
MMARMISAPRMAQNNPEQMRPAALALLDHPRPLAEIHLGLGSRLHLDALERGIGLLCQTAHKAFDRVVTATKTLLPHQILVNALRTQPRLNALFDLPPPALALAPPTRARAEGQNGWFWRWNALRAGGQNGRF